MKEKLKSIRELAEQAMQTCKDSRELDAIRVKYLGKKGEVTALMKNMRSLTPEERPAFGQMVNDLRAAIETGLSENKARLEEAALAAKLKSETIDVTMPGEAFTLGKKHPLNIVLDEVKDIFIGMGFNIADGPEVETDWYNFEALNIPKDHPARDTQDTFYISDNIILRTQTSPMQIRAMEHKKPPIRILAPGRVFRSDAVDATHSPMFHQIEGLVVDKNIRMSDLKGILEQFAKIPLFVSARTTSRSRSRPLRWICSASSAMVPAARCAKTKAGLRFSAAAWFIRRFWRFAALTRTSTPAMHSASVWSVSL